MADIIYLAFANREDNPLNFLTQEANKVHETLLERGERGETFHVEFKPNVKPDDISSFLSKPRNRARLVVFHFGGHANEEQLFFQHEPGYAEGLAELLSKCSRLKLVVLNGCCTVGWIHLLQKYNIPLVIATHSIVGDQIASQFSIAFYRNLAENNTVGVAFDLAIGDLKTTNKDFDLIFEETKRSLKLRVESSTKPAWGIFSHASKAKATAYRLPETNSRTYAKPVSFEINRFLIDRINQDIALQKHHRSKPEKVIGVLYGPEDECPRYYIDRLRHHLHIILKTENRNISKFTTRHLYRFRVNYQNYDELVKGIRDEIMNVTPHTKWVQEATHYHHQIYYTLFDLEEHSPDFVLSRIVDFVRFWSQMELEPGYYSLLALLIIRYPLPGKKWINIRKTKIEKFLKGLSNIQQKLIIEGDLNFLEFPKLENINRSDFIIWLSDHFADFEQSTKNQLEDFFDRSYFQKNGKKTISMKKFDRLLDMYQAQNHE